MLFLSYLRYWLICPMCHAFPFPYTFFLLPSLHPFSVHLVFITIPSPWTFMPVRFFYHTFTHPNLLSHRYSQQSLFQTLLSSCLSFCLTAILPAPSSTLPLTSCSYFLPLLCLPHTTTTPLSMETLCLPFPSFEAFSRLFQ